MIFFDFSFLNSSPRYDFVPNVTKSLGDLSIQILISSKYQTLMTDIRIKEHLDYEDFLKTAFPDVVKPVYKKRLFIINMAFGGLFIFATIYLFSQSIKNGIGFKTMHYFYLFFALLFPFLAFYLIRKEKKFYYNLVDKINDLQTEYIITDNNIKVKSKQAELVYPVNEIKQVEDLPKWLIFIFQNGERIAIYKPNIPAGKLDVLKEKFQIFLDKSSKG